jgi:hypothetical protein
MKRTFFIILLITNYSLLIDNSFGQSITWQRIYGLDSNLYGQSGIQTLDGGYMIQSVCLNGSIPPCGTYLIKTDAWGNIQWRKNYFLTASEDIIQTIDSGYILCGGAGIFKISKYGDSLWLRIYGYPLAENITSIKKYYDGGFVACGRGGNGLNTFAYVVRTDSIGNLIWEKFIADRIYDDLLASDLIFDNNNNIIIIGRAYVKNPQENSDILLLKLATDGNLFFKKIFYTYPIRDYGVRIIQSYDNNYVVSGIVELNDTLHSTFAKIDTNGNLLIQKYYMDGTSYITKTVDNNYALGGAIIIAPLVYQIGIKKVDQSGNEIWTKVINGSHLYTSANDMKLTADGGFFLVGDKFRDTIQDRYSTYVVKADSEGNANLIGIFNESNNVPRDFVLYPSYPNPFNLSTVVRYDINNNGFYTIEIFDLLGRRIWHESDKFHRAGKYEIKLIKVFDNLSSSVYILKLSSFKNLSVQKLVLIK